jgi:CheY-like chemotaxis protein/nitrogen-specific signal transduction histidine kinase
VHDSEGKVVQWFGTNTDITDQLATEEALRRASQAKDDFIAVLSHELRTPLNPALMIASEAATRENLSEDVRADFEVIRRNIEVEARLIDDLLDLTRISRGKLPLVLSTVSVDSLIIEALANVRSEADSKGVALDVKLEPGRTFLQGDDVRLRQVLWNVLRNAVKFTPSGGSIALSTRTVGSMFQITVKDSGIGMSMEELARVFEPFRQGEHSTEEGERRFGGLGLGLAISKLLVEQHGGKILARSGGRHCGTTVIIELPRSSAVPAAVEAPPEADSHYHAGRDEEPGHEPSMSILLVEDHDATRQTLAALLERRGHRVTQADTVSTASDLAMNNTFDLLMSDIGLPDGRGDELMVRIRDAQPGMFAIALSGYGMESDIQRSRSAGFALHLTKPVSLQELEHAIRRISRWRSATGATSLATEVVK